MNNKKIYRIIKIIACAFVALIFILNFLSYNVIADPVGLNLQKVTVDEYVLVSGFNYGGIYNYRSYTTKYSDGVLCIRFSGGFDMPWLEGRNSPNFCPVYNKHRDEIDKIYLSSFGNDRRRLIWTKADGEILSK